MGMLDALKKAGLVTTEAAAAVEQEKALAAQQAVRENLERLEKKPPTKRNGPEASE